ncbi:MAG TPA: carboxypeptidase regulatory-like domain-containing protein [Terracidiphilus sp.]|nr:carboxypeptidase regulatory-like domain-containing protein [Terracidiphilus sp.]
MSACMAVGLVAVTCLALAAIPCHGQATTGQITGQVSDPTGAVVPGATITVIDENKGVSFEGRSGAAGDYAVLSLPPGIYSVSASAPGFSEIKFSHVALAIDQQLALNFKLTVGSASSVVTVTDAAPLLQTESAEVGTVLSGNAITDLPLDEREFFTLTKLVPGVTSINGNTSINSVGLAVSGQREYGNSIQMDGIETTTNRTQDYTVDPNVDSVDQFKVITATYNAEFGNAAGGVIAIQTKSGTNSLHGDAYEFFRPNYLAAKLTSPGVSTPQPPSALKWNIFGGTVGFPIKRDRAFLFAAYEGEREKDPYSYVDSTIPFNLINFAANGDVDFSGLLDPYAGVTSAPGGGAAAGTIDPIFDPVVSVNSYGGAEQQFSGNIIPKDRVSPAGLATMLNFYPKPNLTGIDNGWFRNFEVYSPTHFNYDKVDARFDQVISGKDRLYAVYHWQRDDQLVTDPYWGHTVVPGGGDADQANQEDYEPQSISVTYDRIFSPTRLNEVRFGYLFYPENLYSLLNGTDYSTKYGVGNITVPGYPATIGYPQIYLADGYLAGGSTYKPYHVNDQNYQITDNYTWTHGPHEFKFGGDLRLLNSHPNFSLFPTGFDYFDSYGYAETSNFYYTYISGAYNWAGGSDLADLVLGLPTDVYIGLQLTNPHTKSWTLDWFAQDSYKLTPRITVNYGLRYEYQNPWSEANNNISNFDLASGNILVAGRGGNSGSLMFARTDNFSPRFGFDFQLDPRTVIRFGGAIFYSPENDGREDILTQNYPFADQAAYTDWVYNGPASGPTAPWEYQLDSGVARNTTINLPPSGSGAIVPSTVVNGNLETTYGINPKMKTGTVGSFSLTFQEQVTKTTSLEIGYVGSIARHLSYEIGDINANPANSANSYNNLLTSDLGNIQYLTDSGISSYNGMEVKVTKQTSRNTSFLLSYTWSHNLDNGPAPFDLNRGTTNSPQNPYDLSAEYASSDNDQRNDLVFSGAFVLPVGKGQRWGSSWGRVPSAILGGWRYSPIFIANSGMPVNVIRGNNPASILPGLRPNVVGDPTIPRGQRSIYHWFNTAAFNVNGIPKSSFAPGDAGRNLVIGPAYVNLDSSLAKDFKIMERYTLDIRLEAFNTSNTVHLADPDTDLSSGTFGQINSVLGGSDREAQLAAKIIF